MKNQTTKSKKKIVTIIVIIFLILALIAGVIWFLFFGSYTLRGERYLNSKWDKTTDYFNQSNIGNYEELEFQLHHRIMLVFESDATTLVATYSPEEYKKQVENIQAEIPFMEGEQDDVYGDFEIGEWYFEVCDFEQSRYPKNFAMVAFCEESQQIAYLEFYDVDLDTISGEKESGESMREFVKSYFGYRFE